MLKEKTSKIKEIKTQLNIGNKVKVFCGSANITLWINDPKYITWLSYGQSAIKNNLKELTWLLNNILNSKRKDIKYIIL